CYRFQALPALLPRSSAVCSQRLGKVSVTMAALGDFTETTGPEFVGLFDSIRALMGGFTQMGDDLGQMLKRYEELYPSVAASFRGEALAVAATVSYLSIGALTDPSGSRPPELNDVPLFIGSLAQVLEKVIGRLNSPPRQQEGGR